MCCCAVLTGATETCGMCCVLTPGFFQVSTTSEWVYEPLELIRLISNSTLPSDASYPRSRSSCTTTLRLVTYLATTLLRVKSGCEGGRSPGVTTRGLMSPKRALPTTGGSGPVTLDRSVEVCVGRMVGSVTDDLFFFA